MELIENKPLKNLTWMKVGGNADFYTEVHTKKELVQAFEFAHKKSIPILFLGQGSNMIVPDEGIRGLVIRLMNDGVKYQTDYSPEVALLESEAGKILSKLIFESRKMGLNGLDDFVGIPGVVGAAVRGNIGIPNSEIGDLVESVEIFDGETFRILNREECRFAYRGSLIKDNNWLVWSAKFLVKKGQSPKVDDLLLQRIAKQPKGNSCGSFFKNPDPKNGIYAGKLIEECGLKGIKNGGAFISAIHGNFLMNDGSGCAKEIIELARNVKKEVFAKKAVLLENEVSLYDEYGRLLVL